MSVDYREVSYDELFWRAEHLLRDHGKLFNIEDLDAYLPAHNTVCASEDEGKLLFAMALRGEEPLGYIIWGIDRHPALGHAKVAKMGPWFVIPEARRATSKELFKFSLLRCKERGCEYALTTLPIRNDKRRHYRHPLFGHQFETTWITEL